MKSCMNDVPSPQISNETEFTTHSSSPQVQCCLGCSKIPFPSYLGLSWGQRGLREGRRQVSSISWPTIDSGGEAPPWEAAEPVLRRTVIRPLCRQEAAITPP